MHTTDEIRQAAEEAGTEAGHNVATWAEITPDNAQAILDGYDEGDPIILDMMPAPLSGEYAGESIPEIVHASGLDYDSLDTDDARDHNDIDTFLDAYEDAYQTAYWNEVTRAARYQLP